MVRGTPLAASGGSQPLGSERPPRDDAPVDLSIKNVSEDLVCRLRERARRNGRSIQDEVLAILEAAESTRMIRRMRDSR